MPRRKSEENIHDDSNLEFPEAKNEGAPTIEEAPKENPEALPEEMPRKLNPKNVSPTYEEDPDDPSPKARVAIACALCAVFPCQDSGIEIGWKIPTSGMMDGDYRTPPCRNKITNVLSNFEPRFKVNAVNVDTEGKLKESEKLLAIVQADRDRSHNILAKVETTCMGIIGYIEREMGEIPPGSEFAVSRLTKTLNEVMKKMKRDIAPNFISKQES